MSKEMRESVVLTVVALLAVAIIALIAACGGSSSGSDDATSHSEGGQVENVGDELVITMRTEDFRFAPETITVKVGETVRLRLDNHDPVLHDYTADEAEFIVLDADGAVHVDHEDEAAVAGDGHETDPAAQVSLVPLHIAAEGYEHAELVFQATEADVYEFYCSVPGHREAGMVGKIIIEE